MAANTDNLNVYQLIKQGISFSKKNKKEQLDIDESNLEKSKLKCQAQQDFVQHEEDFLTQDDEKYFKENLQHFNNWDAINDRALIKQKTEGEQKIINRLNQKMTTYLKRSKIHIKGEKVPLPLLDFDQLKNHGVPKIFMNQQTNLGYKTFSPIQSQSIPILLKDRNCVCVAPTGSGKTVSFVLPLQTKLFNEKTKTNGPCKAIIFAPTFEQSVQIYKVVLQFIGKLGKVKGLVANHICRINLDDKNEFKKQINQIDLLVTTPLNFLKMAEKFENDKKSFMDTVKWIVLDEADKYFEMGFLEQFEKLIELFKVNDVFYHLFTATLPTQIEKIIDELFLDKVEVMVSGKINVQSTISQELRYTGSEFGKLQEIKNIINDGEMDIPCQIFVQSKRRAFDLYTEVKRYNIPITFIGANLSKEERERKLREFEEQKTWILITTDLLARGLDFPDVNLVINYDMPVSMVNYIHRVGRTGRGGKTGKAMTFYTNEDKVLVRTLADLLKRSGCEVPEWLFKIKKAKKNELKLLAKRGMIREPISLNPKDHTDPEFNTDIKKADKFWAREQKRLKLEKEQNPDYDDGMPTIMLNSQEEVQAFFDANPHLKEQNPQLMQQLEEQKTQKEQEQNDESDDDEEDEEGLDSEEGDDFENDD